MTDEQEKLVIDNHSLIYGFMAKNKLDPEEFYGIFAISLCNAALHYDESMDVKFSTLAYTYMKHDYILYLRIQDYRRSIPSNKIVYYSNTLNLKNDDDCSHEYLDVIQDNESLEDSVTTKVNTSSFYNLLTIGERRIFRLLLAGYSGSEISRMLKCSPQNVSSLRKSIKNKYNDYVVN